MKVFDVFTFNDELDVLKIRLETLYDHVSYFVITEANQTFTLKHSPKELSFWENREKFSKYADKIIHNPLINKFQKGDPWKNEYFQRNAGFGAIEKSGVGISNEDILILSDVDEIPDPSLFPVIKEMVSAGNEVTFEQKMFRYFLNCRCTHELWKGSRAINYGRLRDELDSSFERLRHVDEKFIQGGWHYTGMGGVEKFVKKMQSFSHADICDTPEYTDIENMKKLFKERVIEGGVDVHHFNNATYEIDEDPNSFLPPNIRKKDFEHLIYDGGDWS